MHDRTSPSPTLVRPPATEHTATYGWKRERTQTIPSTTPPAPWTIAAQDPERAVTELSRQFPHATIWAGEYTGSYWALTSADGTPRLLEGATPDELRHQLRSCTQTPRHHRPPLRSSSTTHQPATSAPHSYPTPRASSVRRPLRQRLKCRGRHCMTKTADRSGRC